MAKETNYLDKNKGLSRYVTIDPAWHFLIAYCKPMQYGEIKKLHIQDGLPILAEEMRKKIKFPDERR